MHSFDPKRVLIPLFLIAVLCALTLPSLAQERFGNVAGTVTDVTGAIVIDATVTVVNMDTNRTVTVRTRSDGTFTAADIEPGRYKVNVEKAGFSRFEATNVLVLVGKTSNLAIGLKVGVSAQVVEVTGAAAVIDTTSTMIAQNVTAEEIALIPKARGFEGLALLSPSVNTGSIEGGYQINGASGAENGYYIDGVAVNSLIDGSARQSPTFDYLQEVQVKTAGLDAEYGGALGGVVSAITKSGGNSYHGSIYYYYYGNKLNASPTQRMTIDPTVNEPPYPFTYFQDDKQKLDNHEFGGAFGGPLLRNKVWAYTALSPRWQQRRNDYHFSDADGSMRRRSHQMNWFSKLSFDPASRIRTNFTFLYTPQYSTGALYPYNGYGANISKNSLVDALSDRDRGYNQSENSVTGQLDYTLTNSALLSVKGGRYRLNYKEVGVPVDHQYNWAASSIDMEGVPAEMQRAAGTTTPSGARTFHDLTTRTYIQADFSQITRFGGQHTFKFGVGTAKNVNNVNDSWNGALGRVNLWWANEYRGHSGAFGFYSIDDAATNGTAGSNITHLYVQDSWKIVPRLTINAGVRFEKEAIPSFRPDIKKYALLFGYGDKVAPRIGASFDVLGTGKIKVSGGWGRYYDWTKYDLPRGTFGGDVWHRYYRTLDSADVDFINGISLANMPGEDIWMAEFGEPFRDLRIPGFDTLDPNVKPMSSDSMNAGVEWEIIKNMVFSGRYSRSKLNRTIEDMGVLVNGSEAYFYGNPGEGQNKFAPASGASCPETIDGVCVVPMPKAKRTYDALEMTVGRRFSSGYIFNASYVYSRLWGNYSGLQSTDEIRPSTLGYGFGANQVFAAQLYRPGGNANRYFDLDEAFFDARGRNGLFGRLPTDRPHVFKFYGAKQFKWGTEVGGFFRLSSGTPVTTQVSSTNGIPIYVNGRGDAGRTPVFNQTDLMVAHNFKVGEGKSLRIEMNMMNLFNQKTNVFTFDRFTREEFAVATGIDLSGTDLTQGFNWQEMATDVDSRYGHAAEFNRGFEARLLLKYTF